MVPFRQLPLQGFRCRSQSADATTAGLNGMGLNGFLRKPFRAEDLLRAVFDAVGR